MQNVFSRDMFSMGSFDGGGVKCNGHGQLSGGRTTKKDRKGCKKEKIETVLKNRLIATPKPKVPVLKLSKIGLKNKNAKLFDPEEKSPAVGLAAVDKPSIVKAEVPTTFKETARNDTLPTVLPPVADVPEQVEDRLCTVIESLLKKTKPKKKKKSKPEKNSSSVNKKSDKLDTLCVSDADQLSCSVITVPPKKNYAKLTNWQKDCGTRHETLQRILKECEKEARLREDLYTFGELIYIYIFLQY